jgi:hypothetical protein
MRTSAAASSANSAYKPSQPAQTVATYLHPHQSLADGDGTQKRVGSEIRIWHDKATGAHDKLAKYLAENIKYTAGTLPEYIYATQLTQSEALATAYRSWRRLFRGRFASTLLVRWRGS